MIKRIAIGLLIIALVMALIGLAVDFLSYPAYYTPSFVPVQEGMRCYRADDGAIMDLSVVRTQRALNTDVVTVATDTVRLGGVNCYWDEPGNPAVLPWRGWP